MRACRTSIVVGDRVKKADHVTWAKKGPKHRRNGCGGNAAVHMSIGEAYLVTGITSHGGLQLEGFKLPVSGRDVVVVSQ